MIIGLTCTVIYNIMSCHNCFKHKDEPESDAFKARKYIYDFVILKNKLKNMSRAFQV